MVVFRRKPNRIVVSDESLRLLQQMQDNMKKVLTQNVSYDEIIKLTLEKPSIIVVQKEERRQKKAISVFGEDVEGYHLSDAAAGVISGSK